MATVVFVAIGVIDVRYGHTLALAVLIVIVVAIAVFGGSGHR